MPFPQKNAFDLSILRFHHSRAYLFRGDADLAVPLLRAGIEDASWAAWDSSLLCRGIRRCLASSCSQW